MAVNQIPRVQDELSRPGVSARDKYATLIVGRPGWDALVRYELVVMLSQSVPGALGLALRKYLYPLLLGSCGRNVVFGQNVVLRHPHKIHIGDNVVIDDNCLDRCEGGIELGHPHRQRRLHRPQHDSVVQERRHRAGRRREHRLQLRDFFRESRARRSAAR